MCSTLWSFRFDVHIALHPYNIGYIDEFNAIGFKVNQPVRWWNTSIRNGFNLSANITKEYVVHYKRCRISAIVLCQLELVIFHDEMTKWIPQNMFEGRRMCVVVYRKDSTVIWVSIGTISAHAIGIWVCNGAWLSFAVGKHNEICACSGLSPDISKLLLVSQAVSAQRLISVQSEYPADCTLMRCGVNIFVCLLWLLAYNG